MADFTSARPPVAPIDRLDVVGEFTPSHRAIDLGAAAGQPVYAPEDGEVWVAAGDNDIPGFEGMGPAFVYMRGDSGRFHLLGELGAVARTAGKVLHDSGEKGGTEDSQYLLRLGDTYRVKVGDVVGIVGASGRMHWEMTPAPRTGDAWGKHWLVAAERIDPRHWLSSMTATVDDDGTTFTVTPRRPESSGGGLGLLLVGYLVGRELDWW